jgi:hypothetical protein
VHLDKLAVGVDGALEVGASGGAGLMIELVERPKTMPGPPVASITASAESVRISMVRRSMATLPPPARTRPSPCPATPSTRTCHHAVGLVPTDLLVEGVEELLAGGGPGERSPVVERSTEAAEVEESLGVG